MRAIPGTMATQHPDNAFAPYWDPDKQPFIGAYQEMTEAVTCFKDLGVNEYMWDWEGKHADAAVIDRLFSKYYDYFAKSQLGRDKFLTFRIPNIWEEKGYNLLQAMTAILSGEDFARDLEFGQRPLFEVILPMTERPEQLMRIHILFQRLAQFKSRDFTKREPDNDDYLELIPLVESVESQLGMGGLLEKYVALHDEHFGFKPEYIRPFLAFSDSSLSSGLLAGALGNKLALTRIYEFSEKSAIPVYPIAGPGSLNFRGGLKPSPASVDRFLREFPGVRTVTVQSSFRYDHPKTKVKAAIAKLEQSLPGTEPRMVSLADQKVLVSIIERSAKLYKKTLDAIVPAMNTTFANIPKRRDRRQHIGLLAYSRSVDGHELPRAITFTAGFYSVGVPPEFIAAGRTLKSLQPEEMAVLNDVYPGLAADYESAGRYLNMTNLRTFAADSEDWKVVLEDVEALQEALGIELGPKTNDERRHHDLSTELITLSDAENASDLITQMGTLRKSLG
ncbi:MAG TPA: phosphoenolpyruvate carboxylase [Candidatus Saccharimonadales bacterium]|nr:phosphoenolpyruvate carboxylase [Candidatus Saccharimonadales bacterium]